jgi:hypothetical protein
VGVIPLPTMELARLASQELTRPLELPEDGRGKRVARDTMATSREREAIVRVIHSRPGRILAGWILAVSLPAMTALAVAITLDRATLRYGVTR